MKLHLGKITNLELAQWFGIGESTFKRQKEQRLIILEKYCRYHTEGTTQKKVIIDEIYIDTYEGDKPKAKQKALEFSVYNWNKNGYDTIYNVTRKNSQSYFIEGYNIKDSTVKTYTYLALKEAVGYSRTKLGFGDLGSYSKEWGTIKPQSNIEYRPLTTQEKRIKQKITEQFYDKPENQDELMIACIIQDGQERKLTGTKINEEIGFWKRERYELWKQQVEQALGFKIEVIVKIDWSAF